MQRGGLAMATVAAFGMHHSILAQQAAGAATGLTLRAAIAEALTASPALRAPDDGRTLADIRQRQQAAAFGVKLRPTLQSGTDPYGLNQRSLGWTSQASTFGTTVQFSANSYQCAAAPAFRTPAHHRPVSNRSCGGRATATAGLQQARRDAVSAARATRDSGWSCPSRRPTSVLRARRSGRAAARAHSAARLRCRPRPGPGRLATELDVLRADLLASSLKRRSWRSGRAQTATDALKALIGRSSDA
jgi:hypothetical protein